MLMMVVVIVMMMMMMISRACRDQKIIEILISPNLTRLPTSGSGVSWTHKLHRHFISHRAGARRLTGVSGDWRETMHLFQRASLAVQRYNSEAFKGPHRIGVD